MRKIDAITPDMIYKSARAGNNDIGPLNQIVHMWAYKDLNDRAQRRNKLAEDPAWQAYLAKATDYVATMENKILSPAPFFTPPEVKG